MMVDVIKRPSLKEKMAISSRPVLSAYRPADFTFGAFDREAFYNPRQTLLLKASCLIFGLLIYFVLPNEPYFAALCFLFAISFFWLKKLSAVGYSRHLGHFWLMLIAGLLLGSAHAQFRATPMLGELREKITVTGWVQNIETRPGGAKRLTLDVIRLKPDDVRFHGANIRLSTRNRALPEVGDLVRVRTSLIPPPLPLAPGAYDPAVHYYFGGISANGFTTGHIKRLSTFATEWFLDARKLWHEMRQALSERLRRTTSERGGALITALIAGDRTYLDETEKAAFRAAGIAHILSISGLHMVLIAGTLFWLVRAMLALSPTLALGHNIKAWAAIGGFFGATFYLVISGAAVPTFRAWIMVSIGFMAILVNRRALSIRNVVIAALIILALGPQQILQPGFQMTFAATLALIAFYERYRNNIFEPVAGFWPNLYYKAKRYIMTLVTTTLVAGFATMPIAAYHFGTVTLVGLLGNMLVLPLFGAVVMPCAVMTLLLLPFGLEQLALIPMDIAANMIIDAAALVAELPGARLFLPEFHGLSLVLLFVFGLMAICLTGSWRYLAVVPLVSGLGLMFMSDKPDVLVSPSAKTVMVYDAKSGASEMSYVGRGEQFLRKRWLQMSGNRRDWREVGKDSPFICQANICRFGLPDGNVLVHVKPPKSLRKDEKALAPTPYQDYKRKDEVICDKASIIVTYRPVRCGRQVIVLEPTDMSRGVVAITYNPENGWTTSDTITGFYRPWTAYRR